jgi:hypothetical protein
VAVIRPDDSLLIALAALALVGAILLVMNRQRWFRRLTGPSPHHRRHHVRRRRRPKFRRAA